MLPRNDSPLFTKEWYVRRWNRLARLFIKILALNSQLSNSSLH